MAKKNSPLATDQGAEKTCGQPQDSPSNRSGQEQIPQELRESPQWVLWRSEQRNGKDTKVPYSAKGGKAKSNDPGTWSPFKTILQKYQAGGYNGVGFVFSLDDPFCGIDLDHCRDPKTGIIEPWAEKIIKDFSSYCEISPSGTGVHIIAKGELSEGGRKKGNVEIYDSGRYFTVTGNHLEGTPQDIRPAQEALNAFLTKYFSKETLPPLTKPCSPPQSCEGDSELIKKAVESKNGKIFDLLYLGRWQQVGYPSQSEADQAFCNMLAFWTDKDAVRIDRIFRQSGLMRPKWDERHHGNGDTYGKATIDKAISSCRETYSQGRYNEGLPGKPRKGSTLRDDVQPAYTVIDIAEFLARQLPPRENILAPWLPSQGLAMIHSKRGIGKTFVSLNIAYAVACGGSFLRWKAPHPAGVLFIDGEMPANVIQERLAQIVLKAEIEPLKPLLIMTPDLQSQGMPDLSTGEGQKAVEKYLLPEIELVIIDNISTLSRSGKENEAASWLPLQEWSLKLRAQGKAVLFIHHSGKSGLQRGTSKREDILDTVINLRHTQDYEPAQGACFEVHFEKSRGIYGSDVEPFEARLEDGVWTMKSIKRSAYEKVIKLTIDGYSQKEIGEEIGKSKGYVSKLVRQAKAKGDLS